MKRFGCSNHLMHPMDENDEFLCRLYLLIITVKAALQGYPAGEYRKSAAVENSKVIHQMISSIDTGFLKLTTSSHLFRERVKLLTVMVSAVVGENYPLGVYRREAIMENITVIEEQAFPHIALKLFDKVLKVA